MTKKLMTASDGKVAIQFDPVLINPEQTLDMVARPCVNVIGPYYLGIRAESGLTSRHGLVFIQRLQFANITPMVGYTDTRLKGVPQYFFVEDVGKKWPLGLMPIAGPRLCIANTVLLTIHNYTHRTQTVNAIVWATQDLETPEFQWPPKKTN